jgi:peptidoglycan/LPS O-acetylase OafA/YrhL
MTSTEFPNSRRLLRIFAGLAWTGMVFILVALLAFLGSHGPARAVITSTFLSGGLFLCIVGIVLHHRGKRVLARLRQDGRGHTR